MPRLIPNGWSRSETARWTAVFFPAATRSLAGSLASWPVDLHIRGCPPQPTQLLKGLLTLLEPTYLDHHKTIEATTGLIYPRSDYPMLQLVVYDGVESVNR
jgi:hypothetical protein